MVAVVSGASAHLRTLAVRKRERKLGSLRETGG